jgi:hypothetical protein
MEAENLTSDIDTCVLEGWILPCSHRPTRMVPPEAVEGRIHRHLFRTESVIDSSSSGSSNDDDIRTSQQEQPSQPTTRLRTVLHVTMEEVLTGASIADQLWPAAEYLATFCLQLASVSTANVEAAAAAAASGESITSSPSTPSTGQEPPTWNTRRVTESSLLWTTARDRKAQRQV